MSIWKWLFGSSSTPASPPTPAPVPAKNTHDKPGLIRPAGERAAQSRAAGAPPAPPATVPAPPADECDVPAWLKQCTKNASASRDSITVYDLGGNALQLTLHNEKASGGEGTVYTLPGNDKILIKIYKDQIINNPEKLKELRRKIVAMHAITACRDMDFLAWPLMPVCDEKKQIIGFAMKRCEGKSLLALRGVDSVKRHFPNWNRKNLALAAKDFVRKVRLLKQYGVQINDFNPANFLVDCNGNVSFIDCDSFQISPPGREVSITRTFFPSHCPPEL